MVTANMDGTDKKLLLIGKSRQPRGFPRDHAKQLVRYRSSTNAWMTATIFSSFLSSWDRELKLAKKKILLLLDNATCHPDIGKELTSIQLEFLLL